MDAIGSQKKVNGSNTMLHWKDKIFLHVSQKSHLRYLKINNFNEKETRFASLSKKRLFKLE
jgi:hypothetical protein